MGKKKKETIRGLGAKYGGTLRKRNSRVFKMLKAHRECPSCSSMKLRRAATGIWTCGSCGYTIAGGAFDVTPPKRT
ncbi:MAG: 50S ribosomal protein L37 [Thaumarchaeota archaeon]|nr:50S ribosomal protein L37 [Nitrososphaerota archaeon]